VAWAKRGVRFTLARCAVWRGLATGFGLAPVDDPALGGVLVIGPRRDEPDDTDGGKQQNEAPDDEADSDQHGISSMSPVAVRTRSSIADFRQRRILF
jgi:hypothetical protein